MSRIAPGVAAASAAACAALLVTACGSDDKPAPDRDQIRSVVTDFFHNAVDGNVEAICQQLTGPGRAQAAGRGQIIGRPPVPVSEQRCVDRGARTALGSVDLPGVIDRLRVKAPQITSDRAQVMVCLGLGCRPQKLRKTDEGWKIDEFQLPVND